MSIFSLGARSAVLAVMLALATTSTASAGTYASGCILDHLQWCQTTEVHTYDDHYAWAPTDAYYIASWLTYTSGAEYHITYGFGTAAAHIGTNTSLNLVGHWGNFSGSNDVWITSRFRY